MAIIRLAQTSIQIFNFRVLDSFQFTVRSLFNPPASKFWPVRKSIPPGDPIASIDPPSIQFEPDNATYSSRGSFHDHSHQLNDEVRFARTTDRIRLGKSEIAAAPFHTNYSRAT